MHRKIRVSGGCQVHGIIEALQALLVFDEVEFLWPPHLGDTDSEASFIEQIRLADVWITTDRGCEEALRLKTHNPGLTILKWPQIVFPAFHPDITLASNGPAGSITAMGCTYNSAICLWAWQREIPLDHAVRLFCGETFAALGYLDLWDSGVARLRRDFVECELDFERFFLPVKRQGVFMHSSDHAKLSPIVHVARQLADKLGVDRRDLDEPVENFLGDTLIFDAVWPIYPEIGKIFGVPACYRWKRREVHCRGLRNYIELSYADYETQAVDRDAIRGELFPNPVFDGIMTRQAALHA